MVHGRGAVTAMPPGKGKTTLRCSVSTEVIRLLDMQLAARPHAERGDVVEAALKAFLVDSQAAKVPTLTSEITTLKTAVLAAVRGTPQALDARLTQLERTMATVVTELSALRGMLVDAEHRYWVRFSVTLGCSLLVLLLAGFLHYYW
jgi:hypothetical protein